VRIIHSLFTIAILNGFNAFCTGDRHKKQRKMLNPVFSAKHMKYMIPMFYDVSNRVGDAIAKRLENGAQEIDILEWVSRTALELVGVAGLGHSFDNFEEGTSPSPYVAAVKRFT
jgi:cytochrome P450